MQSRTSFCNDFFIDFFAGLANPNALKKLWMVKHSYAAKFIVTFASYHGVQKQKLKNLEDNLSRVFCNNVMPANAAAWYMAKRQFYVDPKKISNVDHDPVRLALLVQSSNLQRRCVKR